MRKPIIALLALLLLALLAALCCVVYRAQVGRALSIIGLGGVDADMTRPSDLELRYEWNAGTMPPPYHYEYIIEVGADLEGAITFYPDYSGPGVPEWREAFPVQEEDLDRVYALMVETGVFRKHWSQMRDRPVGGDTEWLDVAMDGRSLRIPALPDGGEALQPVFDAIRALVPSEMWERLLAKRQEYEEEYER